MTFSIHITARALREIDETLEWYAKRSPQAASRWHAKLMQAIASLDTNPERCGLAPEDDDYPGELRQLLYGKRRSVYRVLFEIRADAVFILRVRHAAQDLLKPDDL